MESAAVALKDSRAFICLGLVPQTLCLRRPGHLLRRGICFKFQPAGAVRDPEVIAKLLDDVCDHSGVRPLGTLDGEIARARIGGKLLVLRETGIDVRDDKSGR